MRILIGFAEAQRQFLDDVAKETGQSRAAVVRQALDEYANRRRKSAGEDAFGLWKEQAVDGLAYQERLRAEW